MKPLFPALCLLALTACSDKPPQPQATPTAAASVSTPWDSMKQDEQRARDVQKIVDKQAAQQAQQADSQTQ